MERTPVPLMCWSIKCICIYPARLESIFASSKTSVETVRACAGSSEHLMLASAPGAKIEHFCADSPEPSLLVYNDNGHRREKTCLLGFANNKGADQPAHPRSLISAFVIRLLESIISRRDMFSS